MSTAIMDIGSGSVRLLLNGKKTTIMTKLGEGLGESGRLCEAGMRRTVATIRELTEKARAAGADVVAFATEAVRAAENAKKSAVVSADGKDVEPDKKWTTQQAMDALTAAVDTARTAAAKEDAAQAEIDAAKAELEKAVADFNAGLKNGTKTAEDSSSEGSSSTSESGGCGSSIAVGGMLTAAVICGAALLLKRRRG